MQFLARKFFFFRSSHQDLMRILKRLTFFLVICSCLFNNKFFFFHIFHTFTLNMFDDDKFLFFSIRSKIVRYLLLY